MPYTPPAQRSPATSKPNSPILSRNHSYSEQSTILGRSQKPALPRSHSSTSYLSKHRRSPSISTQTNAQANGQINSGSKEEARRGHGSDGSFRRHYPHMNKPLMPPGDLTTPPDSSDDEDRGRHAQDLRDLEAALATIPIRKEHSPNRDNAPAPQVTTVEPQMPVPSLSAEARKISHSRSSSEITLSAHVSHLDTQVIQTSSSENSDNEDEGLRMQTKPGLLRKKSGELVKPALRNKDEPRRRPSSMPGTPTYHKAVHFNENMEQVRHFLKVDRPIAVSAGSSPVETYETEADYPWGYDDGYRSAGVEWEIKLTNFPGDTFERKTAPVRVERLFLASDNKTLVGTVAVANISFHKLVVARFTLDYWKTTSEVVAEYNQDVRKKQANDGHDRFNFNIKLADQANLESKTLLLCVRYQVNGQEFWDNNNDMNYQIDFIKKTKPRSNGSSRGSHGLGAIPRSSRNSPGASSRPRSMPAGSLDDDFGRSFDTTIRLKSQTKPASRRNGGGQAFSTRYDFGASLTAALSNAQNALGDMSGLRPAASDRRPTGYFPKSEAPVTKTAQGPAPVPGTKPNAASSDKPALQSAEYNELIQKFCFFGTPPTGKGSPMKATTPARNDSLTDGTRDAAQAVISSSSESSASSSPQSPVMPSVDGANDARSVVSTHFSSRSTSPGPFTGSGPDDMSNSSFQYGYSMHGGIFPERSHTPTACV